MVVNQQLKQFAAAEMIEFREPLTPTARTKKILDKALREIREGDTKNWSPAFTNSKDMDDWLDRKK